MNKLVLRGIILIIIVALLLLIFLRVRSPFGKANTSFAAQPKEEITKVEFSQSHNKLILEKRGETWLINGKTEARKSGILFILRILKEIKIKSPVSSEMFKNEISGKNVIPVKVKVYENGKSLSSFLVYKTGSNIYGNVMKMNERSKPFIVYVPDYEGDIGSGFSLNELFWQPYTIFNLLPSEIASVHFENFADTSSSFSIINRNSHYFLSGDAANRTGWDSLKVVRYVSYFAWVPFESWAIGIDQKSLENQPPLYRLTILTPLGKKNILKLWGIKTKSGEYDSDRLLGQTNERNDLFIMRYFDVDPLIKKKSYFYPEKN